MTTLLYLLIAALIFFIIGHLLAKLTCNSGGERYLSKTPVDPVTEDDGSCEEEAIVAKEDEIEAEKEAVAEKEAAVAAEAKEKAEREAQEKAEAAAREAKERAEKEAAAKKETLIAAQAAEKEAAQTPEGESTGAAPAGLLDAPRGGKKDNLTRIKGIGVKIDQALNGIGIWHFDQIAAWTDKNMAWADSQLAFPGRAKRDDWVGQAKLLAEGKETEFSKRVDKGEVASSKKS